MFLTKLRDDIFFFSDERNGENVFLTEQKAIALSADDCEKNGDLKTFSNCGTFSLSHFFLCAPQQTIAILSIAV